MHHQSTDFGDHVQRVIGGAKAKTVDEVFDLSQAADHIGIHRKTLERMLADGTGPAILHITDKRRGILGSDLENWLRTRRRVPASQVAA
jgi:hypothetical protein